MGFCGNFKNHPPHVVEQPSGRSAYCEGVNREEVKEEIVEKYDPAIQAEDGTAYSKVTIMIEDEKGVTIISSPRASFPHASAKVQEHIPLDVPSENFYPDVEFIEFQFKPHKFGDEPAVKIERVVNDGKS